MQGRWWMLGSALVLACSGQADIDAKDDTDTSSDTDGASETDGGTDTDGAGVSGDCWEAATLLDVSQAPGAGDGYDAPELSGWCEGDAFIVESNGMPTYTFVPTTPNALVAQDNRWEIPRSPAVADAPTDIPLLGLVGFAVNGMPFFGPNEAAIPAAMAWGDPVYNGITDGCLGHTAQEYHYHALLQKCLVQEAMVATPWTRPEPSTTTPSPVIGWAMDGFPIYGPQGCLDEACTEVVTFQSGWTQTGDPTSDAWDAYTFTADEDDTTLDACNGRFGPDGTYRYHATETFPYILGCFTGTADNVGGGGGGPGGGGPGGGPPGAP